MNTDHHYSVSVEWTGNRGTGTSGYRDYGRDHIVRTSDNPELLGSADRAFRGDPARWNPEELLLAALAECHMLSYLHVAVKNGVTVLAYDDDAVATLEQVGEGGHFTSATLRPRVTVADASHLALAETMHVEASELCFIDASVNFPVTVEPAAVVGAAPTTVGG